MLAFVLASGEGLRRSNLERGSHEGDRDGREREEDLGGAVGLGVGLVVAGTRAVLEDRFDGVTVGAGDAVILVRRIILHADAIFFFSSRTTQIFGTRGLGRCSRRSRRTRDTRSRRG